MKNFKELLLESDYDFLRNNEHLKDRILFLCLGGSHSYGTNVEGSDVDVRGVALPSVSDLLGLTTFEQFQDKKTDTVIYSLPKFVQLVSNCNPNIIEMLFCEPEHYLYVSPLGQYLLDHRDLFLTKRALYTFGGYAHSQLNRLENALVRNGETLTNEEHEIHVNRSVQNSIRGFEDKHLNVAKEAMKTYVDQNEATGDYEIYCDFDMKRYPMGELHSLLSEVSNIQRSYQSSVGQANKKKDDLHLNKHMMHLMRLFLMSREILEECTLHTFRPKLEREFLLAIRNGDYRTSDGGVKPAFYEILNGLEERCNEAAKTTKLPKGVDKDEVLKLLTYIYKNSLFKEL